MNRVYSQFWLDYAAGKIELHPNFKTKDEESELGTAIHYPEYDRSGRVFLLDGQERKTQEAFTDIDGRDIEGRKIL